MGYSYFTVDTSVWQDGVTFKNAPKTSVSEQDLSFKAALEAPQTAEVRIAEAPKPLAPTDLTHPVKKVQELPAYLADVEDLTPFIVSADNKPGERFEAELKRTAFSENKSLTASRENKSASPYNMSETTAKAREEKRRALKGPGDAKLFTMDSVKRYTNMRATPAFAPAPAPEAVTDAQKAKMQKLQNLGTAEAQTDQTKPAVNVGAPVDIAALRAQASSDIGYKRDSLPSMNSEKTSAAASWFPEAMTRTLDMYEAMNKAAAYGAAAPAKKVDEAV